MAIEDYTVAYTLNGEPISEFCTDSAIGQTCEKHPTEIAGDFTVTITAVGYVSQTKAVTVSADECHVIGETVEFTLVADE